MGRSVVLMKLERWDVYQPIYFKLCMMIDFIIVVIVIMIIIALKAQIEIFYNLLTALQTVSSMYAQAARSLSCANHIGCSSHSTYRVPRVTKGQLGYHV